MKQKDEPQQPAQLPEIQNSQLNHKSPPTEQERLQNYFSFFQISNISHLPTLKKDILQLLPPEIEYDKSAPFAKRVIVKIIRSSKNYEFIDVEVRLGYFRFQRISIANHRKSSPIHSMQNFNQGSYGKVYFCSCRGNSLAFKCFSKLEINPQIGTTVLERVIEEYCLLKLASCWQIGPKIYDIMGYDIMVYHDCIQICMESCYPFPNHNKSHMQKITQEIKSHLLKLHSVKIIHFDLKLDNLCYSPTFKKCVLIDFGLSKIIQETIGFKSFSKYRGTLEQCGDQMQEIFKNRKTAGGDIDLYYNDMFCLKTTFERLAKEEDQNYQERISKDVGQEDKTAFYRLNHIKYNLFQMNQEYLFDKIIHLSMEEIEELLIFVPEIPNSSKLQKSFQYLIPHLKSNSLEVSTHWKINYAFNFSQFDEEQLISVKKIGYNTLEDLNFMNQHCILSYYFNQFLRNASQLFTLLKNTKEIQKLETEIYLILLSKAIQINASNRSLQELDELCKIAFSRCAQLYSRKQGLSKHKHRDQSYFFFVTQFMFKKAYQHKLSGYYFEVFSSVINNILVYNILSNAEILQCYSTLLQLPLKFSNKLMALLKFQSAFQWQYMSSFNLEEHYLLKEGIDQLNRNFLSKLAHYSQVQVKLLKIVLQNLQYYDHSHAAQYEKVLSRQVNNELKMWSFQKQVDSFQFLERNYFEMKQLSIQMELTSTTLFEYYHFHLINHYIIKREYVSLQRAIQNCKSSLKSMENCHFLINVNSIYLLRKSNYIDIETYLKSIQTLENCRHPLINLHFQSQLYVAFNSYNFRFRQYEYRLKKQFFQALLGLQPKTFRINENESLQLRCFKQLNTMLKLYFIQNNRRSHLGTTTSSDEMYSQAYLALQKELGPALAASNGRKKGQILLVFNVFLFTVFFQQRRYDKALAIGKYLIRLSNFISSAYIDKELILQFIISYVLDNMPEENAQYKHGEIYFQYIKLIDDHQNYQRYYELKGMFAGVLEIMYMFCPQELPILIGKISKKLMLNNDRRNIERYIESIAFLNFRNSKKQNFKFHNLNLEHQLKLFENPYNILYYYLVLTRSKYFSANQKQFITIFGSLRFINIYAKQYILKTILYEYYLINYKIKPRSRMKLLKTSLKYNQNAISCSSLLKFFVKPSSLAHLKKKWNLNKLDKMNRSIQRFKENTIFHGQTPLLQVSTSYGLIVYHNKNITGSREAVKNVQSFHA